MVDADAGLIDSMFCCCLATELLCFVFHFELGLALTCFDSLPVGEYAATGSPASQAIGSWTSKA